jgi:hypothetical protein
LRRFELREYLAREPAALRLAAGEVVTCEYLRHEQQDLRTVLAGLPKRRSVFLTQGPGRYCAQRAARAA